jgi:hypothetical protein
MIQSSSIKEIKCPFPPVKNPDTLVVTFEVKFKTEVISKFPAIEKFKKVNKLISSLREDGMSNKQISDYLNSKNIKSPKGTEYSRNLIGSHFYTLKKRNNRIKHSKLKLTNIRFWVRE